MEPDRLDRMGRQLPQGDADRLHAYLDTLSGEQRRGLAGARDRLAILAESDVAAFLEPRGPTRHNLDLLHAVQHGDVVLFRLDADRRPLMAAMLAAAIVSDLLTVAAEQQAQPRPTVVLVDEFSAIAPAGVARLFGRGRSAGFSLLLGTQELADLHPADNPGLVDQVLGNVTTLIAHRQVVPDSAEAIAAVAGTRGAWLHTHRTDQRLTNREQETGTRSRGREFVIHPDDIKQLQAGWALVANPGLTEPKLTRMLHPQEAQ
ncbi:MAG: TraM recognition domain-containing protein [Solirubrobacteraceae bacterium]